MEIEEVLERLKSLTNPEAVEGMTRFGITTGKAYSVSIPGSKKVSQGNW
jgi:hypothetical protein